MKTYVVGHKNPDTDSIVSAIAYSSIEGGCIPARAGNLNKETEYVLNRFGFEVPVMLPDDAKEVILVDTNGNSEEMAEGLSAEKVKEVIDHHKLGGLVTATPIEVYIKPYGSTATLIKMFSDGHKKDLDKKTAGILLAGIISDTLNFKSPIATEKDKKAAAELAKISGVDPDELAEKMFAAKSDISDVQTDDLVSKDYKVFDMSGKKVGVGVWETTKPQTVLERKDEIAKSLAEKKKKDGLSCILFGAVDILGGKSHFCLSDGDDKKVAEKVFGGTAVDGVLEARGVVSRKKQMIPPLEKYFASV